jgi:hypothetical protein
MNMTANLRIVQAKAPTVSLATGGGGSTGSTSTTGIVASTNQTQGQQPLTTDYNLVETVANPYDTVTLRPAVAGSDQIVGNAGANSLLIYPASGDIINDKITNGAIVLFPGQMFIFKGLSGSRWYTSNQWPENVTISPVLQIQTTDATVTTIGPVPNTGIFIQDDTLYNFECSVNAIETDSLYHLSSRFDFSVYRKNGADAVMLGGVNLLHLDRDHPDLSISAGVAGGTQAVIYATGLPGITIDWTAYFKIFRTAEL